MYGGFDGSENSRNQRYVNVIFIVYFFCNLSVIKRKQNKKKHKTKQ